MASQSTGFQHLAAELRLYAGDSSLGALARELKRSGSRRAVVVCGRSVAASPAMQALRAALGEGLAGESPTVKPNSPVSAVQATADALRAHDADAVIAIGGGSAAVTARAAAILLAEQKPVAALCTRRLADGSFSSPRLDAAKLPQFVLPTTPSTAFSKAGSAVHDDESGERLALFDPKTRARAIFLHPAFLCTAPEALVREAALNTFTMAVEALLSPGCDPVSQAMLMHALRLTARHLQRMAAEDAEAREALAVGAVLCGRGTDQGGGGLASVLAHAIGHRAHVGNGIVNAVVLPHTMRFNAQATQATGPRVAEALVPEGAGGPLMDAADAVAALLAALPVPRRLRDIGLVQDQLDAVAEAAMGDFFISRSPRRVEDVSQLRGVLDAAW